MRGFLSLAVAGALVIAAGCGEKKDNTAARQAPAAPPPPVTEARNVVDEAAGALGEQRIARQVRQALVALPSFGVFDNLGYQVNGDTVALIGSVTRPTLKTDAENAVMRIEGVKRVDNHIEVLPLSPDDDRIRIATYRAIYGQTGLDRYALQAVPPIHIIVKNGNVALEGVVASEMDKNMAEIQAKGVPGVFSVTNNLKVAPE